MSQPSKLLTSSQVAELLGKSKRTIQRMADKGELEPFGKLPGPNGAYLFDREVVEARVRGAEAAITADAGAMRLLHRTRNLPGPAVHALSGDQVRPAGESRHLTIRTPRVVVRTGTDS